MPKRADYVMVDEDDPQWKRFWEAYPKRVAKKDARKAWAELSPSPDLVTQILEALEWQAEQPAWTKDGGQYVPFPASWLRACRWDDQPTVTAPPRALSQAVADPMTAWLNRKAVGS